MTNNIKIIFLIFTLSIYTIFCLNINIINNVNNGTANENEIKLWIYFKEKEIEINNKSGTIYCKKTGKNKQISEIKSIIGINNESIKRRRKQTINNQKKIEIDNYDIPVSNEFINEIIKDCSYKNQSNIIIGHKSNWLNSISISILKSSTTSSSIIKCISNKSFVSKVETVLKLKKSTLKHTPPLLNKESTTTQNKKSKDELFYGKSYKAIKQLNIDKLHELGYNGSDVTILILDGGFNKNHIVFKDLKIIGEYNFVEKTNDTNIIDSETIEGNEDLGILHGTSTLSLLGGFLKGEFVGGAYGSNYLLGKTEVATSESTIEEDNWIAALEWGDLNGAHLVSSSLGYSDWFKYYDFDGKTTPMAIASDIAFKRGMLIVNSVGNEGINGINEPADGNWVISVGSVNLYNQVSDFSSIGPTSDGRVKPDIMALGVQVPVAYYKDDKSFINSDGTSLSCPLVASGIALLMQAHPNWTIKQIYQSVLLVEKLKSQEQQKLQTPNILYGYGLFNAYNSYLYKPIQIDKTCNNHGLFNLEFEICQCDPNYYGEFCQLKRIECSPSLCNLRGGICSKNKFNCINPFIQQ